MHIGVNPISINTLGFCLTSLLCVITTGYVGFPTELPYEKRFGDGWNKIFVSLHL